MLKVGRNFLQNMVRESHFESINGLTTLLMCKSLKKIEGKEFSTGVAPYLLGTFQTTEGNKREVGRNLCLEQAIRKDKCPYQNF